MFSYKPLSTTEIAARLSSGIKIANVSVVKDCLNLPIPAADRPVILRCFYDAVEQYANAKRDKSAPLLQIITEFLKKNYNPFTLIDTKNISIADFAKEHCSRLISLFEEHLKRVNQELLTAVTNSDCAAIRVSVQAGAKMDGDEHFEPVIHIAASNSSAAALTTLLELGASATQANKQKYLPLHTAAKYSRLENITVLLDHKVDANQRTNNSGLTALHIAAHHGNVDAATLLLNRGANPFIWSATYIDGKKKLITSLDACYTNKKNQSHSLSIAIVIVRALATIADQKNLSLIFSNIKQQPTRIILIANFIFHVQMHHKTIPKLLLSLLQAELSLLPDNITKDIEQHLQTLRRLAEQEFPSTVIIENALSRRKQDHIQQEKLTAAIIEGHEKEIPYLLDDESVCIEDKSRLSHHLTPLILASSFEKSSASLVSTLLSRGAYVHASIVNAGKTCTALNAAAENGYIERMKVLIAAGATVNPPDKTTTAMHKAAHAGQSDVIDFLLTQHASAIALDEHNRMPIQLCRFESNNDNRCAVSIAHNMALAADKKNIADMLNRIFYLPKSAYEMMTVFLVSLEKRPRSEKSALSDHVRDFFSKCFPMWRYSMAEHLFVKLMSFIPDKIDKLSYLDNCVILNVVLDEGNYDYLLRKRHKYLAKQQPKPLEDDKLAAKEVELVDAVLLEAGTWHRLPANELEPVEPTMTAYLLRHFAPTIKAATTPQPATTSTPAAHAASTAHTPFVSCNNFRPTPAPTAQIPADSSTPAKEPNTIPPASYGFHL